MPSEQDQVDRHAGIDQQEQFQHPLPEDLPLQEMIQICQDQHDGHRIEENIKAAVAETAGQDLADGNRAERVQEDGEHQDHQGADHAVFLRLCKGNDHGNASPADGSGQDAQQIRMQEELVGYDIRQREGLQIGQIGDGACRQRQAQDQREQCQGARNDEIEDQDHMIKAELLAAGNGTPWPGMVADDKKPGIEQQDDPGKARMLRA